MKILDGSTVSQLQKPITSLFSHQGILDIRECVQNTYEKLEMDADWRTNDAAKMNKMESAVVKHEIGSNYEVKTPMKICNETN